LAFYAQIANEGNFKIEPGTTVSFGTDFLNKSTATLTNDGDLYVEGDFSNHGTVDYTGTSGTTYFHSSGTNTQVLSGSSNAANFYNISINNTATDGQSLSVIDNNDDGNGTDDGFNLHIENTLHIESGQKLRLMGESQLVQNHTGVNANTGTGHLLKDQQGALNTYRYNYWASPVNQSGTYKVTQVLKDATIPDQWSPTQIGFTSGLNGNTSPFQLSTRWFWKYLNGSIDPYNDTGWLPLFNLGTTTESADAAMNPGEGYCMKGPDATGGQWDLQNYTFQGVPNNGTITLSIDADKEYLVGNPYPSAIDGNQFLSDNAGVLNGTIYYYEHWSDDTHTYPDYGAGYATYNGITGVAATLHMHFTSGAWAASSSSGVIPGRYIPVGQGFVVRSSGTAGGTITFQNTQRIFRTEGNDSEFFKSENNTESQVTGIIRLGHETSIGRHRYLALGFTDGMATDGYEMQYDAEMIDFAPDDMCFKIAGSELPFVIQGAGPFYVDNQYILRVNANNEKTHSIILDKTENFDEPIYILDFETGLTHDIRTTPYTFNIPDSVNFKDFGLVFQPHSSLDSDLSEISNALTAFYNNEEIIIHRKALIDISGIEVYNSLGQVVLKSDSFEKKSAVIHIPFSNFALSTYIVKIHSTAGTRVLKFINN
jgi:hypothetical protein